MCWPVCARGTHRRALLAGLLTATRPSASAPGPPPGRAAPRGRPAPPACSSRSDAAATPGRSALPPPQSEAVPADTWGRVYSHQARSAGGHGRQGARELLARQMPHRRQARRLRLCVAGAASPMARRMHGVAHAAGCRARCHCPQRTWPLPATAATAARTDADAWRFSRPGCGTVSTLAASMDGESRMRLPRWQEPLTPSANGCTPSLGVGAAGT